MKLFLQDNVYEAALKRMEWIFNEFENIVVCISAGKDSTALLGLTVEVAEKLGRLPVKAMFIDQEDEWQYTIDYMRLLKKDPRIELYWFQCPVLETNAANHNDQYLCSWDPAKRDKWMREPEPGAITGDIPAIHKYADEFKGILAEGGNMIFNNEWHCKLGGVRAEESLARLAATTYARCYKDVTWGKMEMKGVSLYPLYDWATSDIWTYIAKKHLPYNRIYDLYFNYGVRRDQMRVSSLHHETAYRALFMLQELDRKTYDAMCKRLDGVSTLSQMQDDCDIKKLPEMFTSWKEYRDYLLEHLIRPDLQDIFRKRWQGQDDDEWYICHCQEVMANDTVGTKNGNMRNAKELKSKIKNGYYDDKRKRGDF